MLRDECIRERCSWWYQGVHREETNKCLIPLLRLHIAYAMGEIQAVKREIIDVYNKLVDIEQRLSR